MSSSCFSLRPSVAAVRFALLGFSTFALMSASQAQESAQSDAADNVLPAVQVTGSGDFGFTAQQAVSSTKSDKPLFETPQSISVLTRELLDARQVTSLNEAIQTTAGVSSGGYGRRGWDDFSIRGQRASESIYVDGLKLGQGSWIAQEVFGVERIEIVKGPASINFGQMQPGGIVNMVSKRPRAEAFGQVGFTVGSYGYRQATFDFGRPLESANGKAAFRINAMLSDADDPTDYVYYKNRYIAPSISLDFGPRTDFTILASYYDREYIRQQGLPTRGSLLPNPNGQLDRSLFIGDPGVGPYEGEQSTIGYALTHRFDSGWTLRQNFRWLDMNMTGRAVFVSGGLKNNYTEQGRSVTLQDVKEQVGALDTNIERTFNLAGIAHTVMAGLDLNRDKLHSGNTQCKIANLNIYSPTYNLPYSDCAIRTNGLTETSVQYAAVYLRDQIKFNERLSLNVAFRHDRVETETVNLQDGSVQKQNKNANTGNAALMYELTKNIAPYIGYATSFLPQAGLAVGGRQLNPEEGKQSEMGVKFQSDDKRLNASIAYYDLTRKNVASDDLENDGYQVEIGEQRSKGFEAEVAADLRNGWSLAGALALIDAEITDDTNAANIGKRLQNVPRRAASFLANYRFDGALQGWGAGFGIRHESAKTGPAVNFSVPGYTVADANVSYQGAGYRVMLNVKNLFDKDYFAGTLNANVVPLGDPRTVMLKAVFDF
ncbi:TonB-dependent siderophore receptor [Oxalicibacterium flavum]|nr:TonB-dependent siderophore receptor [Oxalicibacterium flavum]